MKQLFFVSFQKKHDKVLAVKKIWITFALAFREMHLTKRLRIAAIAQLVERDLAKVEVAGPSPVCRSLTF